MEQYISKSAVVAEIERRIKERDFQMKSGCWVSFTYIYEDILDFLDTLEVKEIPEISPEQALRAVEIAREEIKAEIERLIKSYSPIWSSEGKYRIEAYKEVLDIINSNYEENNPYK